MTITSRTPPHDGAFSVRLPFDREAARTARDLVDALLAHYVVAAELRQDAALVVHELVVNAVVHGAPVPVDQIELTGCVEAGHLVVTVLDGGHDGRVAAKPPSMEAPNGRGLAIVEAICSSWSVDRSQGTLVQARLAM
jgi:serine/threonine-protein kinase RsbW